MTVAARALRELHRIHKQLSDLRERQERGPKQVQARQTSVEGLQADLDKHRETTQRVRVNTDKKQLDLKASEEKIVTWKAQLNMCSTNKEYQALMDQIAAAEMANSVLSDEILEALEEIDVLETKIGEAENQVISAGDELDNLKRKTAVTLQSVATDIDRLEADLCTAEDALPADFRVQYDRIVNAKAEDALAEVEAEFCGGCYQKLTPNIQNDVAMARAVFCKSCGRLLYLPEDRTAS